MGMILPPTGLLLPVFTIYYLYELYNSTILNPVYVCVDLTFMNIIYYSHTTKILYY